ncbi:MAG TPA: A/G-specific adenine glycosylase [Tepidisphaeraceae bacterium]|jgi:A/G-specific adenine glycosylase|nr:A/G-specific adenine glycosylase [Tepidisphaeraceae bacterium]
MLSSASTFARRLLRWYDRSRRDLPWRVDVAGGAELNPYHVLVSETMLQQTQVATVIPYFHRFLARFPTLADLAAADEQEVLRHWQGLGYYSRARNLQSAARMVVGELGGTMPCEPAELLKLPGVGRYTAGAVASIAFGRRAPILDANVQRVLCRLDAIATDPRDRRTQQHLWRRAEDILPRRRVGDFNSAMMELGALVCTPRNPQCLLCPVREHCEAFAAGVQEKIPAPKKAKPTPLVRRRTYCVRRDDGQWLLEQRPATGRWAGMWQFITIARDATDGDAPTAPALPIRVKDVCSLGMVTHGLTHRRYEFEVFHCKAAPAAPPAADRPRRWTPLERLEEFPLPRPHLRIAEMLRELL